MFTSIQQGWESGATKNNSSYIIFQLIVYISRSTDHTVHRRAGWLALQQLGMICVYTTWKSDWLTDSALLTKTHSHTHRWDKNLWRGLVTCMCVHCLTVSHNVQPRTNSYILQLTWLLIVVAVYKIYSLNIERPISQRVIITDAVYIIWMNCYIYHIESIYQIYHNILVSIKHATNVKTAPKCVWMAMPLKPSNIKLCAGTEHCIGSYQMALHVFSESLSIKPKVRRRFSSLI